MRAIITSLAVLALAGGAWGQSVPAAEGLPDRDAAPKSPLRMVAVASHLRVAREQTFYLAAIVSVESRYFFYGPDPGETKDFSPMPASISVLAKRVNAANSTAPPSQPDTADITVGDILWPPAKTHESHLGDQVFVNRGYDGSVTIYVPLTPKKGTTGEYQIQIALEGQVCSESECVPVREVQSVPGVVVGEEPVVNGEWESRHLGEGLAAAKVASQKPPETSATYVTGADYGIAAGFALALLAGLILNIMPCVLPVIPLKVLGMVQQAGQSRRRFVTLGLAFAGGVVMFFAGIAAVNVFLKLVLRSAFQWGEHFQSSPLRIGMAALMAVLAANLFGLFTVLAPKRAGAAEAAVSQKKGHLRAVGMGLLTGVLATPCSFSILAAALAFAQSQTLLVGSLAIVVIGVGMALPYAILTAFPSLVKHLPRPGRWMEIFKQSMGFAMVLVALWLLSTLFHDTYPFWVAGFVVLLILAIWMWGWWLKPEGRGAKSEGRNSKETERNSEPQNIRTFEPKKAEVRSWNSRSALRHSAVGHSNVSSLRDPYGLRFAVSSPPSIWIVRAVAILLVVSAAAVMLPPPRPLAVKFEPFDQARIDEASRTGRIVLVDFTASWCLTCKQVEYSVYNNPEVAATIAKLNVLAVRGDITTADMPANELKKKFGQGIPVTVIFPPDQANGKKPIVLDGLFTSDRLVRELKDVASKSSAPTP